MELSGLIQTIFVYLFFQWVANPANDMYADTVTTVILEIQSNPKVHKGIHFFNLIERYRQKRMRCSERMQGHFVI